MADSKIDPYDLGALERSVNDSATRVSGLWLSFVAFSAYLAAAASMISHRQIFLEEPIKLPTINIDLPLVASAILLPLLFVIYHVFVLLQVVLLARTADAYNQTLDRAVAESEGRTLVRQRLANTLFAQLFAGSPREREGALGLLLRLMAWITLAIAPVFVLAVFEIKFLPYHSTLITWTHRGLIAFDVLAVLFLWAAAISPANDIKLASLRPHRTLALGGAVIVMLSCFAATFPGEPTRTWMRLLPMSEDSKDELAECRFAKGIELVIPAGFDRLVLPGEDVVDDAKLKKILKVTSTNKQKLYQSERTQTFRNRDLRCARFAGADFRHVDFKGTDLSGAILRGAHLEGATFAGSRLVGAILDNAQLQESSFAPAELLESEKNADGTPDVTKRTPAAQLSHAHLRRAQLQGANLEGANLEGAHLDGAQLRDARFKGARLVRAFLQRAEWQGAFVEEVDFRGANFHTANLQGLNLRGSSFHGADLRGANLQGAKLTSATFQAANLDGAYLHGTDLSNTDFRGAVLDLASLQGAIFDYTDFRGASLYHAKLVAADFVKADFHGASLDSAQLHGAVFNNSSLRGASLRSAQLHATTFEWTSLEGAFLDEARFQGASLSSNLTGVRIANAFLWRTQLGDPSYCLDADVVSPRFDRVWDIWWSPKARALRTQELNSVMIEVTLGEASKMGLPVERLEKLQADLTALLDAPADDDDTRARHKAWSDCAEATKARSSSPGSGSKADFEASLAELLIELACTIDPNRETEGDRAFVVEGIHRNRINLTNAGGPPVVFSQAQTRNVARAFLGLDGKPCRGAEGIGETTRAALVDLANASPAN